MSATKKIAAAIQKKTDALRSANRIVAASLLQSWKSGLSVIFTALLFLFPSPAPIYLIGKIGTTLIALLTWLTDAYFIRKRWERDK